MAEPTSATDSTDRDDDGPRIDRARLDLLHQLGFGDIDHDSHVPFMSHLNGVHRVLKEWGSPRYLCDAGLFHSAYGTEYFRMEGRPATATAEERQTVRSLIGEQAEQLAFLWCTLGRQTIDAEARTATDWSSGESVHLADGELEDIVTLWAADTVEQIHRMAPAERDFANGLAALKPLASDAAQAALDNLDAEYRSALTA